MQKIMTVLKKNVFKTVQNSRNSQWIIHYFDIIYIIDSLYQIIFIKMDGVCVIYCFLSTRLQWMFLDPLIRDNVLTVLNISKLKK